MKRFNFTSVLTALLAAVSVGMTTVPALASNSTHNFTFNFDYGNIKIFQSSCCISVIDYNNGCAWQY